MRKEIKHLQGTLTTTMIYVTHDQIEAMAMADRIVVMDLGVVQQVGTPAELFDNPANLFCAGFIGEPPMNIVTGKLVREADRLMFQSNGVKLPVTNPAQVRALDAHNKGDVILGVRPTHVAPRVERSAASIPAEVYGFEPHGDYNIVTSKIGAEILLAVSGSDFFPDPGQAIHLEFNNNLHFFDVDTKWNVLKGQGVDHG